MADKKVDPKQKDASGKPTPDAKSNENKAPSFVKKNEDSKDTSEKKGNPFGKKDAKDSKEDMKDSKKDAPDSKGADMKIEKGEKDKVVFNPDMNFSESIDLISEELIKSLDEDELLEMAETLVESSLIETLSYSGRMKHRAVFRRIQNQLDIKRERSLHRRASNEVVNKRARHMAINRLKERISPDYANASYGEKQRIERMVMARKKLIAKQAKKLTRTVRQIERDRLNRSHGNN